MFVNLTPHAVTFQEENGNRRVIPPSGRVARIGSIPGEELGTIWGGVLLMGRTTYGEPEGLPDPGTETHPDGQRCEYIVSALFAGRVGDRADIYYPGTGPNDGCIREDGRVVAVTRLIRA